MKLSRPETLQPRSNGVGMVSTAKVPGKKRREREGGEREGGEREREGGERERGRERQGERERGRERGKERELSLIHI